MINSKAGVIKNLQDFKSSFHKLPFYAQKIVYIVLPLPQSLYFVRLSRTFHERIEVVASYRVIIQ